MMKQPLMLWPSVLLYVVASSIGLSNEAVAEIAGADDPSAYTEAQYRRDRLAFNLRTMVDAYKQVGHRNPEWDDLAIQLLESRAAWFTNHKVTKAASVPEPLNAKQRLALINQLYKLKCDDPLVRYCQIREFTLKTQEDFDKARKVYQDMVQSDYPINRKASAATWILLLIDP